MTDMTDSLLAVNSKNPQKGHGYLRMQVPVITLDKKPHLAVWQRWALKNLNKPLTVVSHIKGHRHFYLN